MAKREHLGIIPMRTDVANLLERLGKRDFHYQDFAERFTDMELWPLFETLIRDSRILDAAPPAVAELAAAQPQTGPQQTKPEQAPAPSIAAAENTTDLAALFARYGGAPIEDTPSDVHALLQRLAKQLDAQQQDGGKH